MGKRTETASPDRAGLREPRWALWNYDDERWDEVPAENQPGIWRGGHDYGAALLEPLLERPYLVQPRPLGELRAKLLHMANVAAEKRPMTDVARGYERACDEVLEWLAARLTSGDAPKEKP